ADRQFDRQVAKDAKKTPSKTIWLRLGCSVLQDRIDGDNMFTRFRPVLRVLVLALSPMLASLLSLALAVPLPQDLETLSARARQAMAAGKFDEAAKLYRQLVVALPDDAAMRFNLGLALHSAG